ncbi:MAG: hypothetical protein HKN80_07675 [Acidimicrobiia bacterium]|nr:hypothetical protein [Acidimicrobiia bacterium]
MKRTLKLLSLIGVLGAAGVAAAKRTLPGPATTPVIPMPDVSHELRQALSRFEERFGA